MTIDELKTLTHDKAVITQWLNNNRPADKAGTGWICPFCGNGTGKGAGEGLVLHKASGTEDYLIHCFSEAPTCGRSWDLIGFVAQYNGLDTHIPKEFIEACKLTAQQIGVELEEKPVKALDWDDYIEDDEPPEWVKQKRARAKEQAQAKKMQEQGTTTEVIDGITVHTHYKALKDVNDYKIKANKDLTPELKEEHEATIKNALESFDDPRCKSYLNGRGISTETAKMTGAIGFVEKQRFRLKETGEWKDLPGVVFKKGDYCYSVRSIEGKGHAKSKKSDAPFNLQPYIENQNDRPIFIVEGNMDCLSILEAGEQAISLDGVAGKHFLEFLAEHPINNPFIVMLDNDETGQTSNEKFYQSLKEIGHEAYKTDLLEKSGYKDANEFLTSDREGFIAAIKDSAENYRENDPETQKYLEEFNWNKASRFINGIAESVNNPPVPTGFKELDKVLDGGLYEGLYIIGGISSLGKTAISLQLADQIATAGHHVIFYSLEMSENELMARSISRNTSIIGRSNGIDPRNYKTVRGITNKLKYSKYNKTEHELIQRAIQKYFKDTGKTMRIVEAQGTVNAWDIQKEVENHIQYTGKKPVVFIDYLQLLTQPHDLKRSMQDKERVDRNVFTLKQISRDHKIPIFAISSFNRDNYYNPVSMESFKESGAIEYSSDVLIGIERQGQPSFREKAGNNKVVDYLPEVKKYEKKHKERFIHFKILKNRNGAADVSINFNYQFMFNDFIEGETAPYLDKDFKLDKDELAMLNKKK